MLKPLEQWVCDDCGKIINSADEGYVEWLRDKETHKRHGFRIIHHAPNSPRHPSGNCYKYSHHPERGGDLQLSRFIGPAGMAWILSFLDSGPYHERDFSGPGVKDVREYVELMRRFMIPFYEEARLYWETAVEDGFFDGENDVWIYLPEKLKELIRRYGSKP